MKRETRDAAVSRADRESAEATRNRQALNDILNGLVQWLDLGSARHPSCRFGVSRLTGAMGGLLLTRFAPEGLSRSSTTVELLDDAAIQVRAAGYCMSEDKERFARAVAVERAILLREKELRPADVA